MDTKTNLAFLAKGRVIKERIRQLLPCLQKGPILVFKNGISLFYTPAIPGNLGRYISTTDTAQPACPAKPCRITQVALTKTYKSVALYAKKDN